MMVEAHNCVFCWQLLAIQVTKIMVLETCVYLKMTHVLLAIKMMEGKLKFAFYLPYHALLGSKIMDLETFVFLGKINVQMDIKMMAEKQLNAFLWIKIAPQNTSMMVVAQFASP